MHALYDLKEMLLKELEDYGKQGELSAGSLDIVDKLAHATKNLDKVIMCMEGDYSSRSYDDGGSYRGGSYRGGSYRGSYDDGSYARGYSSRRDSMGRYSRNYSRAGDMAERLREMIADAPDDHTRQELQRLADQMGQK